MAKVILLPHLTGLSGTCGNLVFRQRNGRTFASRRPDMSRVKPSVSQLARRARFQEAASYGRTVLADPASRAFYEALAAKTKKPIFALALGDFLKPPEIHRIDDSVYLGRRGDEITVFTASADPVVRVTVTLQDMTGRVLETGEAVDEWGLWTYRATTVAPRGQPLTIVATAYDRPGNQAKKSHPWIPLGAPMPGPSRQPGT